MITRAGRYRPGATVRALPSVGLGREDLVAGCADRTGPLPVPATKFDQSA
jgi:hypothetical protein